MRSFSADLLSVLESGSSMCRAEWYVLSGLERFASIEIREGRLPSTQKGTSSLSDCQSTRRGALATSLARKCSLDEGDGGMAVRHRQSRFLAL